MPREPPVVYLYPLSNYQQGGKGPLLEKDASVKERMIRMADLYKKFGMRRVVEGLLLAHEHSHPHVLLLQIGNTYFKLPGGRLRVGEHETDGLRRKLSNKLGTPNADSTINWQVGELVSTWWRPNFETVMYPYIPPQVATPKECRKIFLTQLPPTGILGVPKNLKLLAVPLFELYDNAHRYGPVIASLPQLLARIKFVFCDHNAQPLINEHINAYQISNIQVYHKVQKDKAQREKNKQLKKYPLIKSELDHTRNDHDIEMSQQQPAMPQHDNANMSVPNIAASALNMNPGGNHNNTGNVNANSNTTLSVNPLLNYRAGLLGNIYNIQRQLQLQQLYAAQAQANILRIPPPTLRAPNARLILTPPASSTNPLMLQQMAQSGLQQPPNHNLPPPSHND